MILRYEAGDCEPPLPLQRTPLRGPLRANLIYTSVSAGAATGAASGAATDGGNHGGAEEEGESGDSGELHFELMLEKLLNLNGVLELLKLSGVLVDGSID